MRPENIVWQFGSGRTGSTWLSRMVRAVPGFAPWGEPLVGKMVGDMWRWPGHGDRRDLAAYVFPEDLPDLWRPQLRSFVLSLADARFPGEVAEHLYASEPNGAQGAVPLMRAFPDSRLVFLLRDPRDVVASFLAAAKAGWLGGNSPALARDADRFVADRARAVSRSFGWTWEAYSEHEGPKARVRYEDLRADPLGGVSGLLDALSLPGAGSPELRAAAARWSWENPD